MITFLGAACIGITLSGCAADESVVNESIETPETFLNSQGLYEQFLSGDIPVTFNSNYTENIYLEPILENGNSYTLTELGECVSKYYFDSKYMDKKSYDYINILM